MRVAIITGASSGIGAEFAKQIDTKYRSIDELWLVGRSKDKLMKTATDLQTKYRLFALDLTAPEASHSLTAELSKRSATLCLLVNCAGFGTMGAFIDQPVENALGMVDINVKALTELTHKALPFMRPGTRIINVASSAAFLPQQDFAVYAATKSYVLNFSRALGAELKDRKITVTAVCPGPVDTPFFDIAEKYGQTLAIKKFFIVSPEKVVAQALLDAYRKKSVSVCSIPIKVLRVVSKIVPVSLILSICRLMK